MLRDSELFQNLENVNKQSVKISGLVIIELDS